MRAADPIDLALKLLQPEPLFRDRWRADIERALQHMDAFGRQRRWHQLLSSKETRGAVRRYEAALKRAQTAANHLPEELRDLISLTGISENIEGAIEFCKVFPVRAGERPKPDKQDKLEAAKSALLLLKAYDRPVSTTKGSVWCRLAAILYGEPRAKLNYQCLEVNRRFAVEYHELETE